MEGALASYGEGILKTTVGKLGSFLWSEALLIWGVKEDVQFIRDEILTMDAFLHDIHNKQRLNQQEKVWMLQVLEVASDADNCIEEFTRRLSATSRHGPIACVWRRIHFVGTLWPRYRIGKTIQVVKKRAEEVSNRRARYNIAIELKDAAEHVRDMRMEADPYLIKYNHQVPEDAFVGKHTNIQHVGGFVRKVRELDQKNCTIVSITGPSGSGKTALAKMAYRRRDEFFDRSPVAAWVTCPNKSDLKLILHDILRQLKHLHKITAEETYQIPQNELEAELRSILATSDYTRYFLVLDSLSISEEDWGKLKLVLPTTKTVKVVVITTSLKEFPCPEDFNQIIHPVDHIPPLDISTWVADLTADHMFSVLEKDNIIELAKDYGPYPLAIKCMLGLLAGSRMEFRGIKKELDTRNQGLKRTSAVEVSQLVQFSYEKMSPTLKRCIQDLSDLTSSRSGLPDEVDVVSRSRLIQRWVGRSLVGSGGDYSKEEVAERTFDELISRGAIEPESVSPSDKIRMCRMNGLYREAIIKSVESSPDKYQQINDCINELGSVKKQKKTLVSLKGKTTRLLSWKEPTKMRAISWKEHRKTLTVIDLEGIEGVSKQHMKSICKCTKLKFLSLRNTDVCKLPKGIKKLKLLETLDIRQTRIEKMPESIVKLDNLKHLLGGNYSKSKCSNKTDSAFTPVEVPEGLGALSALQTLAHVKATRDSEILHVVREMTQLRKLGVVIDEKDVNLRPLCISLVMLSSSLQSLSVCNKHDGGSLEFLEYLCFPPLQLESLNLRGHLWKLPPWITSHQRLTKLTLSMTRFRSDAIESLGKVQSLLCLRLYTKSFKDHALVLGEARFLNLKVLAVHCNAIRIIHFKEKGAPKLEVFKWFLQAKYETDSNLQGLENLTSLKQVSISGIINSTLQQQITKAVEDCKSRSSPLVFEKIDQRD